MALLARSRQLACTLVFIAGCLAWSSTGFSQETDVTQTPNLANAGIKKSYAEQIGTGRGDISTPRSSLYIINRDPFRSIRRGRNIFQRKFTIAEGQGPRINDGVGDIENDGSHGAGLADSCAACHGRPRGAAGSGGDVFTRPDSRDAPHLFGLGLVEMLGDEITQELRAIREAAIQEANATGGNVTKTLKSKGIKYGKIKALPDGSVDTSQAEGVNADLRVRPFFHEGGTISIREFVVGAFNAEMGLEAFDPDLARAAAGERVVTPSGMVLDGAIDNIEAPPATKVSDDPDLDGVANEIPVSIVDHMEFYLLNYFKPGRYQISDRTKAGLDIMRQIQCTSCHKRNLTIDQDRRVADVETRFNRNKGIFNKLFAKATALAAQVPNSGNPPLKAPQGQPFVVKDIFADFKRHDLGPKFWERNFDGTLTKEFMTEPLWGVGTSAPYGHDGRSINLKEVILRHGGEAQASRNAFARLSDNNQRKIIQFLQTLVLFPPEDTASNLNPGDPNTPDFPQNGHGGIKLPVLFNDPTDLE